MPLVYMNTQLDLAVGAKDVYKDLAFDVVSGEVYKIREIDMIVALNGDTANTHHDFWLSVLKGGRATWLSYSDGFAPDIIGCLMNIHANRPVGSFPFENGNEGYLADDPYFASSVRFGLSTPANVAGAAITAQARLVVERIKQTQTIIDLMYRRANT